MSKITITINTDSNDKSDVAINSDREQIVEAEVPAMVKSKRSRSKNPKGHCIIDETLLAKILEAGYFNKMRGVNYIDGVNKYFFNYDENIKNIITEYYKDSVIPTDETQDN